MRLTKQTNYAIRILMYCATNNESLSRISEIAKSYSTSELFMFKILPPLVEHGFIKTTRGRNGGITLAKAPNKITLADVIKVTEENFALSECLATEEMDCPLINSCGLKQALSTALNAFFDSLNKVTLADLIDKKYNLKKRLKICNNDNE
ncbi:iron-responsive transcriptional regulator RirA [Bartonella sp. DGB1]|uniref:iron-responsive transcriptional regulator RirA n=1 Tax=Bartonella sp. DGB1 TaxID=3239807 RepID=UPI003526662D